MSVVEPVPGTPTVPPEARSHQGQPAGVVSRGVAAGLDLGVLVSLLLGTYAGWTVVRFVLDPRAFEAPQPSELLIGEAYLVFGICYLALCWTVTGRSIGQQVMGLRVLGPDGRRLHLLRAALRSACCLVFPVGLLWVIVSPQSKAVHDLLLRSRVTYDWTMTR